MQSQVAPSGQMGRSTINVSQQQQEIKAIFDEFKDPQSGNIDASEFLNILRQTGVSKNCSLLASKLEARIGQQIPEEEFHRLYNFNFDDRENFELLFKLIDTSNSGKIGKEELKKANNIYCNQLSLGDRDIEIMINYSGSQEKDAISMEKLWTLMTSQSQAQ